MNVQQLVNIITGVVSCNRYFLLYSSYSSLSSSFKSSTIAPVPPGLHSHGIAAVQPAASNNPVAVPDKIFELTLSLDFIDRCHSLTSLALPLAALGSLPTGLLHSDGFKSLASLKTRIPHWGIRIFGGDGGI